MCVVVIQRVNFETHSNDSNFLCFGKVGIAYLHRRLLLQRTSALEARRSASSVQMHLYAKDGRRDRKSIHLHSRGLQRRVYFTVTLIYRGNPLSYSEIVDEEGCFISYLTQCRYKRIPSCLEAGQISSFFYLCKKTTTREKRCSKR